jgi:hypothetical protein
MNIAYKREVQLETSAFRLLTESGFVSPEQGTFIGQFVDSIKRAFAYDYGQLYEIPKNVDIGTATGKYLDRFGHVMGEPRESLTYARIDELSNLEISIYPAVVAGSITTDGRSISIPLGTSIRSEDGSISFSTTREFSIRSNRSSAFVQAVSDIPGAIYVPEGRLNVIDLSLADIQNVSPVFRESHRLVVTNRSSIGGGSEPASDETYRYTLLQRSQSIGLFNDATVMSLMDINDIVRIHLQKYYGGVNVYIEPRVEQIADGIITIASAVLKQWRDRGVCLNLLSPLMRRMSLSLVISLVDENTRTEIVDVVKTGISSEVANLGMGSFLDLQYNHTFGNCCVRRGGRSSHRKGPVWKEDHDFVLACPAL